MSAGGRSGPGLVHAAVIESALCSKKEIGHEIAGCRVGKGVAEARLSSCWELAAAVRAECRHFHLADQPASIIRCALFKIFCIVQRASGRHQRTIAAFVMAEIATALYCPFNHLSIASPCKQAKGPRQALDPFTALDSIFFGDSRCIASSCT